MRSLLGRGTLLAVAGAVLAVALSGCDGTADEGGDGPRVVAAFYPLAFTAGRVAGDDAEVANLTTAGGEPHDLELGAHQTLDLAAADIVVLLDGFQPAVDDAVADVSDAAVVDAGDLLGGNPDPHFWQDPLLVADLGDAVASALSEADPANAEVYRQRAEELRGELERLDAEFTTGLQECDRNVVVVSHDAFGYLERYGLELEAISGLSPDAEPSAADLARLHELAKREGLTTVFSERLASPKLAETLAQDLGLETAVLDPIEGLTDETADEDYLSLMRANLAALREANGC